eukprot:1587338-Rhodomonas_salina.1
MRRFPRLVCLSTEARQSAPVSSASPTFHHIHPISLTSIRRSIRTTVPRSMGTLTPASGGYSTSSS